MQQRSILGGTCDGVTRPAAAGPAVARPAGGWGASLQQQQQQPRRRQRQPLPRAARSDSPPSYEIRICEGKVLRFAQDLRMPGLDVIGCGCLGNCGNGPNLVVLPSEVVLHHVATPQALADVLRWQCSLDVGADLLRATELRLAGNALAQDGDWAGAAAKYHEALGLVPQAGAYLVHCNLSAVRLQAGDAETALRHAAAAVEGAPRGFHTAHIRLIDALYALKRFDESRAALDAAVAADPSFKQLPEYKVIVSALKAAAGARR